MRMRIRVGNLWVAALVCCTVWSAAGLAANRPADNTLSENEKKAGWKLLFDGKTLDGWIVTGSKEGWAVEDGTLACTVKGGDYIATKEQFGDYILSVDFKYEKGANSGIFFRWADLSDPVNTGIEMQILDTYGSKELTKHDCGAIYDILEPAKRAEKPAGEWNTAIISCMGSQINVRLNGVRVINLDLNKWTTPHKNPDGTDNKFPTAYKDMSRKGHIGFQDHGSRVWFRNIKIKPLDRAKP